MATRRRGNGEGSLFQRKPGGPWVAAFMDGEGVRRERSTRTTSRLDAEKILRKWVQLAAMVREGLAKPEGGTVLDRHAAATIDAHLEPFTSAKRAENRTERHVVETEAMIRQTAEACGWRTLGEVSAEDLERYLARLQTTRTPRTANKHATAFKTFTRWCVADGRLAADPLARVKKPAPTRQRERRMLHPDEWRWLRHAAEHGPDRMGMHAHERRLLYETAIETGLRSGELRALKRANLHLDGPRPYILIEARQTKNRKAARQYLRDVLARDLAAHVARAMPGSAVFNMPPREHLAKMLRADLDAARQAWIDDAGDDAAERIKREGSDFLRATDADGRVLDFHSLRHTCGSWAAMGGASPKALQTLMRHSAITLTLDTYGHLLPDEAAETVHRMPNVEPVVLRMTGTEATGTRCLHKGNYATDYATAGQIVASGGDSGQDDPKTGKPVSPCKTREKRASQAERGGLICGGPADGPESPKFAITPAATTR